MDNDPRVAPVDPAVDPRINPRNINFTSEASSTPSDGNSSFSSEHSV